MREHDDLARKIAERQVALMRQKAIEDAARQELLTRQQEEAAEEEVRVRFAAQPLLTEISRQMDDPEMAFLLHEAWEVAVPKKIIVKARFLTGNELIEVPAHKFSINRDYPHLSKKPNNTGYIDFVPTDTDGYVVMVGRMNTLIDGSLFVKFFGNYLSVWYSLGSNTFSGEMTIDQFKERLIEAVATFKTYGEWSLPSILRLQFRRSDSD